MRQLKKEEAIREYGIKYVPVLEAIDLYLNPEIPSDPRDALAKKLEDLSKPRFDGTLRLAEELGSATRDFHFKDLQDVRQRYETDERARYKKALQTLGDLMTDPAKMALLEKAADSQEPEQKRLKASFEKSYEKMVQLGEFLSSGAPFKIDIKPLKDVITLPDTILEPGATVYVVKDDGISLPTIVSGSIVRRDFNRSLWSKANSTASYEIDTGEPNSGKFARDDNTFLSFDASERKSPAGAVALRLNKVAFNSKAAAVAHIGEVLDVKEKELKAQLKQLRTVRKKLGNGR